MTNVSPYVAEAAERAASLPRNFRVGQVWRPRVGHIHGWNDCKIVAITDHGTCPIIAQTSHGSVRAFGWDGRFDGDDTDSDLDLVTQVTP